MNYEIRTVSVTEHFDNDEYREQELELFPEFGTIDDLVAFARTTCENKAAYSDYFAAMEMDRDPFDISVDEEGKIIDITFNFSEGDSATDMVVTFCYK